MALTRYSYVRLRLHQFRVRVDEKLGPYAEAAEVFVPGFGVITVLALFGIGSLATWLTWSASFLVAGMVTFARARVRRRDAALAEEVIAYLVEGGPGMLDWVLGRLIAGGPTRTHVRPGDVLFDTIERQLEAADYEFQRRVAEALPALGRLDAERALHLAESLRNAFDEDWKSDIRRRVVEGLAYPAVFDGIPLVARVNAARIRPLLVLREDDEIFTALATLEALEQIHDEDLHRDLEHDTLEYSRKYYMPEERDALLQTWQLLTVPEHEMHRKLVAMGQDPNPLVRVAAARNVYRIAERLPGEALQLLKHFSDPAQHRNVRRPVAKERSVAFIIEMLTRKQHAAVAKEVLMQLLHDVDSIIPKTAFDLVERIRNAAIRHEICDQVFETAKEPQLRERAAELRKRFRGPDSPRP